MQSALATSCGQRARHCTFKHHVHRSKVPSHQAAMRQEVQQHILLLLDAWGLVNHKQSAGHSAAWSCLTA